VTHVKTANELALHFKLYFSWLPN